MGFDIKAAVDGIAAVVSQYYPFSARRPGAAAAVRQQPRPRRHPQGADRQLAAHAAGLHRHRAVAGLRLHHLRRPEKFHQRAAAVGVHLVRHPGRDADRRLADRRELRRRHEPARIRRPAHAPGRRQRRRAARRGLRRPRLLLGSAPVQRRQPDQHRPQGGRVQVRRRIDLFPPRAGAVRHAGLRLPAWRRPLHPLRAEPAPDRQECRAVGDVPGLHVGLGVLLLRLAFQRHLPGRAAQARRRDPHHQPDRRRRLRHRRADAEAPDRGSRAAVRHRGLEGLRQAAREPRPGRAGRAGRDREILRAADGGAPPRHRPAAGAHRHLAERAGRPRRQEDLAGRGAVAAEGRAPGPRRRVRRAQVRARRQGQGDRRQARGGAGRGSRRRRHPQAGQGARSTASA